MLPLIGAAFDLVQISQRQKTDVTKIARIYFDLGGLFHFERLRIKAINMAEDHPDLAMAANGIVESLNIIQSALTSKIAEDCKQMSADEGISMKWVNKFCPRAQLVIHMIEEMEKTGQFALADLVVIDQQLRGLI